MKPSQVTELLTATIPARLPVLLTGAPGIGKTDLCKQAAEITGHDLIVSHPVVSDPTDAKGLPWPDKESGTARFLPIGELAQVLKSNKPTVWLIDDLGQAPPAVQASFMGWLLARRFGEHVLPDHVSIIAATNRRQDRAGVNGLLEPIKSRMATIIEVEPSVDCWSEWAISRTDIPAELIAFLRYRPGLLSDFKATTELSNSPSPRGWANLAKLQNLGLPTGIRLEAYAGSIGQGAAVEYLSFCAMYKSLVSVDTIFTTPDTAPIPEKMDQLFGLATGMAVRVSDTTFPRMTTYCGRLQQSGFGEFAVLAIRDALRRQPALGSHPDYTRVMSGPLGKLILGTA